MSYLRWSTTLRDGCGECAVDPMVAAVVRDTTWLPRYVPDTSFVLGRRLCPRCSSCWYVWADVSGCVRAEHCGCAAPAASLALSYEDAARWSAPETCQFAARATAAVREAGRDGLAP